MIYALAATLIIIGFLGYKLTRKQRLDRTAYNALQQEIAECQQQYDEYRDLSAREQNNIAKAQEELAKCQREADYEKHRLEECRQDLQAAMDTYQDIVDSKMKAIEESMEEQRQRRQSELDAAFNAKTHLYEVTLEQTKQECERQAQEAQDAAQSVIQSAHDAMEEAKAKAQEQQEQFNALVAVLKGYEKERQAKLFSTIQLPEEYRDDIEFLLTTVAGKVQHPDIISKLVWSEYVRPNLDDTLKRVEIQAKPGIYKLTNLDSGKCYIGKSTDVKKRINDHFKSAVGMSTIAHQNVHDAIRKTGFWNWTIEVITYCDKDKLSELEKYYIDFFHAQELGYNKREGG